MYSLHHLRYFVTAVEQKSLVRAATILRLTPSALSQAIVALERDLGVQLTSHERNRFNLTRAGEVLFEKGTSLLSQASALKNDVVSVTGEEVGEFTFMTQQSIASTILPPILKRFKDKFPKITPKMLIGTRDEVNHQLRSGSIPFGITVDDRRPGFPSKGIQIHSGKFELVGKDSKTNLRDALFILSEVDTREAKLLMNCYSAKFKLDLPVASVIQSWSVCAELAAAGIGVGLVPDFVLERRSNAKIILWDFEEPQEEYTISAVWRKDKGLCSCSEKFVGYASL